MQLRTVAFTIFTDQQRTRVRCCFCGEVLHTDQGTFDTYQVAELTKQLTTHPCYQPNAQPPGPQVKS